MCGGRWATVKPQSCISSPKGNSAPLEEVTGGFRGRYAQPLPYEPTNTGEGFGSEIAPATERLDQERDK